MFIAALVDVRGLRERPAGLRCGNGGVPAATCAVWSEVRESPHSWDPLPEVSAPILGRIYASDAGSVASEGFQNLSPVTCHLSEDFASPGWPGLEPLASSETYRVGDCGHEVIERG